MCWLLPSFSHLYSYASPSYDVPSLDFLLARSGSINVRLKLPHTWKSWHNNMNQIYGVSIHHVGVDILNTGCWSGFNWGGVFGLQGRWSSHMEWCMQLLWGLLPEDHCIHLHHFCYSPLLCCAFPHLLLQTLQQVRRPHLLQWQRHRDSCIS